MITSKLMIPVVTLMVGVSSIAMAKQIPCEPGTYQDETGKAECKPCPAGYKCPDRGMKDGKAKPCQKGEWCPDKGMIQAKLCPAGAYCAGEGELSIVAENCPEGTYKLAEGRWLDVSVCKQCDAGYYCPNPKKKELCPLGHYCEGGKENPKECPSGTYCGSADKKDGGYSKPNDCPQGYYCPTPLEKEECPAGAYCPKNSTAPTLCPAGKVRTATRGYQLSHCSPCPAGHWCPEGSAKKVAPNQCSATGKAYCECEAGYYCPNGESRIKCEIGYYCAGGKEMRQQCPTGTTTRREGSRTQQACIPVSEVEVK